MLEPTLADTIVRKFLSLLYYIIVFFLSSCYRWGYCSYDLNPLVIRFRLFVCLELFNISFEEYNLLASGWFFSFCINVCLGLLAYFAALFCFYFCCCCCSSCCCCFFLHLCYQKQRSHSLCREYLFMTDLTASEYPNAIKSFKMQSKCFITIINWLEAPRGKRYPLSLRHFACKTFSIFN